MKRHSWPIRGFSFFLGEISRLSSDRAVVVEVPSAAIEEGISTVGF